MTIKIKAKVVKTSNLEAVILTDEKLPVSDIGHIENGDGVLALVSEFGRFEVDGSLTGLEHVFLWSSNQVGEVQLEEPKELAWMS